MEELYRSVLREIGDYCAFLRKNVGPERAEIAEENLSDERAFECITFILYLLNKKGVYTFNAADEGENILCEDKDSSELL